MSVVITIGIVIALLLPALDFFREVSVWDFLSGTRWAPTFADPDYGVLPLITGTLWTTVIGMLVAVPLGLGAAIYLAEYASSKVRKTLKPALEVLAGIPSVVYGYFALAFVAPVLLDKIMRIELGTYSVLAAGAVLGIMIVPTVASLSEDALSAVPQSMRQGSLALGANRMRTTLRVVFPAAISGIAASIVLALSRAVGGNHDRRSGSRNSSQDGGQGDRGRTNHDGVHRPDGHWRVHPRHLDLQHVVCRRNCCCSRLPWSSTSSASGWYVGSGKPTDGQHRVPRDRAHQGSPSRRWQRSVHRLPRFFVDSHGTRHRCAGDTARGDLP
ncbi:MAG: phosphate ABC transporter permease subunit PstC [Nocardioidaceae bacterium]